MSMITLQTLRDYKKQGQKFACLTAYDATFAQLLDDAGIDVILVGDSLGMVIQGFDTTLPVSLDDMIYHSACVCRKTSHALIMVDMPYGSTNTPDQALKNAQQLLKSGAHMVKIEVRADNKDIIKKLAEHNVPVCAHIGLLPQAVKEMGGYKIQGRTQQQCAHIINDAMAVENAGADMLLIEGVVTTLADNIMQNTQLPVIGIGASPSCDGQVLVLQDVLGITAGQAPKFSKNYMAENKDIQSAIKAYITEVKSGAFPTMDYCYN